MSSLKLKITESILNLLNKIKENDSSIDLEDLKYIDENIKNGYITTQTLKLITKYGKSKDSVDLKTILKGSSIHHKETNICKLHEPSAEALERREYLQLRQQQREYNKMVHGTEVSPESRSHNSNQENPYLLIKNQVSVTANMIVSVFVMFGIGYFIGGSISSDENTVSGNDDSSSSSSSSFNDDSSSNSRSHHNNNYSNSKSCSNNNRSGRNSSNDSNTARNSITHHQLKQISNSNNNINSNDDDDDDDDDSIIPLLLSR